MKKRKTYNSVDEWKKEGERLFGKNNLTWKFVCPSCGHIQTMQDFKDITNDYPDLERNRNVVIDSTNTTENKIKQYKTIADGYGYRFIIVLMRTSKEECLKRNVGKGSVPVEVIEKMHSQMSEMLTSEFLKKYEVVYE